METVVPDGLADRRATINDRVVDATWEMYDDAGTPTGEGPDEVDDLRVRLWCAGCYLGSTRDVTVRANAILEAANYEYGHFIPMATLRLLQRFENRLTSGIIDQFDGHLESSVERVKRRSLDFIGLNDNFPAMATYTALVGGARLGNEDLSEVGRDRLDDLAALLRRRGITSEFTSPTYTPIQLLAIAEIANHGPADVRNRAIRCETRLWADLLAHYHPPTGQLAGPYSRAYTVDSVADTHNARAVLWAAFGEAVPISPIATLFDEDPPRQVIHHTPTFMRIATAWLAGADYHVPTALADALLKRDYPHRTAMTYEMNASADPVPGWQTDDPLQEDLVYEYPASEGWMRTTMRADYAMGAAALEFLDGTQTDAFHLLYRRRRSVTDQSHVGAVYPRYVVGNKRPGQTNEYPALDLEWGPDLLRDEGRSRAFLHDNTALVAYNPKRFSRENVDRLRLSLLFPTHLAEPDAVWLGERRLDGLTGESADVEPLFVRDGPVFMAFHPLVRTNHGREAGVRVERQNDFLVASFLNYEGEVRDFPTKRFLATGNGFVAEVRSDREVEDFAAFREAMAAATIDDSLLVETGTVGTNLLRTIEYRRGELEFGCQYGPIDQGLKYVTVDGRVPERPRLAIDGVDVEQLPFN